MRHSAAYDWRRIHSAMPRRNALTCRDGCALLSGEGSLTGPSAFSGLEARKWQGQTKSVELPLAQPETGTKTLLIEWVPLVPGGDENAPVMLIVTPTRRHAMAPAAIRTLGLTKNFGRVIDLDGLDLDVFAGEIFAFLGPNGAGKSTTIRLLLGLIWPTAAATSSSATFSDVPARAR
jgi:hypothetical protein